MGTIPAYPSFGAGEVVTAAKLNQVKAAGDFWALTPRCSVYQDTTQSLPNNALTPVTFGAELFDIVQAGDTPSHDTVTANSRVFIRTAGKYEITAQIYFVANATGLRQLVIRRNSSGSSTGGDALINTQSPATGNSLPLSIPTVEYAFSAGDHIEMFALQSSGGSLGLGTGSNSNFMRMKLVGP